MTHAIRQGAAVLLLIVLAAGLAAAAEKPIEFAPVQEGYTPQGTFELPYHPTRILVKFTPEALLASGLDRHAEKGTVAGNGRTGLASVDALTAEFDVQRIERSFVQPRNRREADRLGTDRWFVLETGKSGDLEALAKRLSDDPAIEEATPDWRAFPAAVPNDPLYANNWGHNNTAQLPGLDWGGTYDHTLSTTVGTVGFDANAPAAWDASQAYGSAGVVIAIIDSGVDTAHPDLRLVAGYDYGDNDSNPMDNSAQAGHGTACAGVAAARANNSLGVVGVAGGCSIMPLKVANSAGSMYFSAIVNAIYFAADNGAKVISMSLGAAISTDTATNAAILYAYNAGCVILAATGNENASTISYPAINTYVIGVGAASPCGERKRSSSSSGDVNPGVSTDPNGYTCDGERWWGSNYGLNTKDAAGAVDIIAPTILPTTDISGTAGYDSGNYSGFFNGTSCATPYAAGVCALIKSKNPTWTPAQIRAQLVDTAQDVTSVESGSGWDRYAGYGMIDAAAAVGGGGPVTLPPVAAFTGTPTSGTFPLLVQFSDQSTNTPTGWSWTFGDGGTSSAQNPSRTYTAAGTYTVTLTASNAYGSDGETKTGYITVSDASNLYASLPFSEGFESGSLSQYWTTSSPAPGRILVTTANTPHSGTRHLTMDVSTNGTYVQNEALLHLNLAGAGQTNLSFWWKEYGEETHTQDGVYFSSNGGSSFVKVQDLNGASYTNSTWYQFNLDVDALCAANGLSQTATFVVKFQQYDNYAIATDGMAFDDISVTTTTGTPPVAAFAGTPTSGVAPLAVQFTDQSTGAPTAWSWNFGDGGTSTAQNPSHTYAVAGSYTVTLTVSSAFGSDPETKANYITVDAPPSGTWETITYDDFEGGTGSYTDGGGDCARYTGGTYAYQGSAAMDIQDNSGTASSFYHTASYNVTGYSELEVQFYFRAVSMDNNEDFWVQYFDGSAWRTVASYAQPANFANNSFYLATVTIPSTSYNFPTNAKLRFTCDASDNNDDVYIDQITFRGLTGTPAGSGLDLAGKEIPLPQEFSARQNYPNPFNPSTTIEFALPSSERVEIAIYDIRGARVATLASQVFPAGVHSVVWNAKGQASGVYFYKIQAGDFVSTKRMTLVK